MGLARNLKEVAANLYKRRDAYRGIFIAPDGKLSRHGYEVLEDLAKFCRFNSSTAMVSPVTKAIDPVAMALAEGRREVYLRIIGAINLDLGYLMNLSMQNDNDEG